MFQTVRSLTHAFRVFATTCRIVILVWIASPSSFGASGLWIGHRFPPCPFVWKNNNSFRVIPGTTATTNQKNREMGLGMSTNGKATTNDESVVVAKETKKPPRAKSVKEIRQDEWRRVANAYRAQVLDPAYLGPAVRASTVEAATHYPTSSKKHVQQQHCLMPGTHKHLGGAYDPTDGSIYGVPANAKAVLCLHWDDSVADYRMATIPLPERIADCNYKWLRGIVAHGYLWAIPAWADSVLCVDLDAFWGRRPASSAGIVQLIPLPKEHNTSSTTPIMQWQWHGAGINHEKTAIFCIPSNAKHVLKVDILQKATSLIPITGFDPVSYPNFSMDTTNKWYGGIVGKDNCVYGIPYGSCAVLKIDCGANTATLIGKDYGSAKYNWHGGVQVGGKIYAHPSHADTVLVIDTNPGASRVCFELPIERAEYDTDPRKNYKWLGGTVGLDGNIYCPACDTSSILKIDVTTDKCTTFGYAGTLKNKVQFVVILGGWNSDGLICCLLVGLLTFLRSGKGVFWDAMAASIAYRRLDSKYVEYLPTLILMARSQFNYWGSYRLIKTSGRVGMRVKMEVCILYPKTDIAF